MLGESMKSLAHIINPVAVPETSDLRVAQPVTFESMRVAKKMAEGHMNIRQLITCYPEDVEAAPADFGSVGWLERSVLDVGTFAEPRRLPLLCDILDRLYAASEGSDYLIYTNVDIALMPSFYLTVANLIDNGYDAFTINRRTISDRYDDPADLPLMYADVGKPHPGRDCFVFQRQAYPKYRLARVCLGAPGVGRTLELNLVAFADRFEKFKDLHATFHIGNDRVWKSARFADLKRFNEAELSAVLDQLESEIKPSERNASLVPYMRGTRAKLAKGSHAPTSASRRLRRRAKLSEPGGP
jgi:hypothetical protein